MQTSFFTDVIVRKPALLQAMLAFNGVTAPVAPPVPAWDVPGFDAAALGEGLARIRGANVLPWRRPSSVAEEGFWDFADESRRLAFVGAEEAERLGLTFGVCVHAPELARIIAREQVLALREELGGKPLPLRHPARPIPAWRRAALFSGARRTRASA